MGQTMEIEVLIYLKSKALFLVRFLMKTFNSFLNGAKLLKLLMICEFLEMVKC